MGGSLSEVLPLYEHPFLLTQEACASQDIWSTLPKNSTCFLKMLRHCPCHVARGGNRPALVWPSLQEANKVSTSGSRETHSHHPHPGRGRATPESARLELELGLSMCLYKGFCQNGHFSRGQGYCFTHHPCPSTALLTRFSRGIPGAETPEAQP